MTFKVGYKETRNGITISMYASQDERFSPEMEFHRCKKFVLERFVELEKDFKC